MSDLSRNPTLSSEEAKLIKAFRRLTEQQRKILLEAVLALARRPS